MGVVVGIDIGGSTTKIVGFDEKKNLIHPYNLPLLLLSVKQISYAFFI